MPHPPAARVDAKKRRLSASEQDPIQRAAWRDEMAHVRPERLLFVDESGASVRLTPGYGWAPRGQRCVGQVPRNWGLSTTLLAVLSPTGIATAVVLEGALDRPVFERFVRQFLVPQVRPGDVVVWDNLSVHKSVVARQQIEAAGGSVVFLPPYSPDFNPIELAFSKLKQHVRRANQRTVSGLWEAIGEGLSRITAQDAQGWYRHCGYQLQGQHL